jgi:hypothetical protein
MDDKWSEEEGSGKSWDGYESVYWEKEYYQMQVKNKNYNNLQGILEIFFIT